jgi:hypothetical protein
VVSAVGPNFATRYNPRTVMSSPPDLHQKLARTLITAIQDSAPQARLICVSTASMGTRRQRHGLRAAAALPLLRTVAVPTWAASARTYAMQEELAASGLDWYAPRPVKLIDGPQTGSIRASDWFRMKIIFRADVAWPILALAENPDPGPQRTPVITTGTSRTSGTDATGDRDLSPPGSAYRRLGKPRAP